MLDDQLEIQQPQQVEHEREESVGAPAFDLSEVGAGDARLLGELRLPQARVVACGADRRADILAVADRGLHVPTSEGSLSGTLHGVRPKLKYSNSSCWHWVGVAAARALVVVIEQGDLDGEDREQVDHEAGQPSAATVLDLDE